MIIGLDDDIAPAGEESGRSYVVFGTTSTASIELTDAAAGTGGFVINGRQQWKIAAKVLADWRSQWRWSCRFDCGRR